jgi:hypothetical protein
MPILWALQCHLALNRETLDTIRTHFGGLEVDPIFKKVSKTKKFKLDQL